MNLQQTEGQWKVSDAANRLSVVLFLIYLIIIFWILLFKLGVRFTYMEQRTVNLVPFAQAFASNGKADTGEMVSNIMIFLPFGVYAGILFHRWNFGKKLFFIFLGSFTIEALQFTFAIGAFDVTDIITNTTGGMIGLLTYKAIEKACNHRVQAQKFLNILAATGTVLMISLLVLLKLNMLPIKYQ